MDHRELNELRQELLELRLEIIKFRTEPSDRIGIMTLGVPILTVTVQDPSLT